MTLAGAPDFQRQSVPTFTSLGAIAINGAAPVVTDVGPLVLPYHQGIMAYWVASLISAGSPVLVNVTTDVDALPIMQPTVVADGGTCVAAMPAAFVYANAPVKVNVSVGPSALGVSPVAGTLLVFGLSSPPSVIPTPRRVGIGLGHTTDSVAILSGNTTAVLAPPATGTYYRIKSLQAAFLTAPAASSRAHFVAHSTAQIMTFNRFAGVASDGVSVQLDMEWFDGIDFSNNTAVTAGAVILYERWAI